MKCPCCGKNCIKPAEEILGSLSTLYMACPNCGPEPWLDKNAPFQTLGEIERCSSCDKAPLDLVMRDALHILIESDLRDESDTLRSVGTPLIEFGFPIAYPPRLGEDDLIIIGDRIHKDAADRMVHEVSEIKGVISGKGVPGFTDSKASSLDLLAGCDLRGDVIQSLLGELVIYKNQSQVHIEFPRESAPKMKVLEKLYFQGKLKNVVDGLCGPGTLGMMSVLGGASRVVLCDIWLPAVEDVMINLHANKDLLGIEKIERPEISKMPVGSEPVLVGVANGKCEIEVYHADLAKLFERAKPCDICLIDHFPGAKIDHLKEACRCCGEVIVV
jgi:hypothetical protein